MKALREEARACNTSVSRLIRTSVETQLDLEKRKKAKNEFLKTIRSAGLGTWEEAHKERTREDEHFTRYARKGVEIVLLD